MNKWVKRIISIVFLFTLIGAFLGTSSVSAAKWKKYDDVSESNSHYEGIKSLTKQDVLQGYDSNNFKPWEKITRRHVAVILYKAGDYGEPESISDTLKAYNDINSNSSYAKEIAMLTEAEVFRGDKDNNFNPEANITREQMASALVMAMDLKKHSNNENVDINLENVGDSHKENVQTLANLELTNRLDDFHPHKSISRAATATLVNNAQLYQDKETPNKVTPGIEVLLNDHLDWIKDKKVGLITNPTGVTSDLQSDIDKLNNHPDVNLTSLYGPEHGIRGDRKAGENVDSYIDKKTNLPVYSLYGSTWKPTEEMLKDVDVLLYDIQDIGSNVYTYIYTLGFAMEAAAEQNKELIVLDRPNPIGGTKVEGPVRSEDAVSFMGRFLLPVRHGMTVGELALMWNNEYSLGADVKVAEMKNWKRTMHFEDTGLPWVMTSPNIPTEDSANLYAGTELLDDTTLSTGLGTTRPFELVGAPWINAEDLAEDMNNLELAGVNFRPAYFTPVSGKYEDELNGGVQIHLDEPSKVNLVKVGLNVLDMMRDQNPEKFEMTDSYKDTIGDSKVANMVQNGEPVSDIIGSWQEELNTWMKNVRNQYLLYPPYPNEADKYESKGTLGILPLDLSAAPGEKVDLKVHGFDKEGNKLDIDASKINWHVPNDIGYVENGIFHAEKAGGGEITATYGNDKLEASREVDVSSVIVKEIRHAVHSDYTRIVLDLNKTVNNYKINQKESSLTVNIPYGEIDQDLDENGGTINIENSPVVSSIDYSSTENKGFMAVFNLKNKDVEYDTPEYSSRLVIDLKH